MSEKFNTHIVEKENSVISYKGTQINHVRFFASMNNNKIK